MMRINKRQFQGRIRRLAKFIHQPKEPVDSATWLRAEAQRVRELGPHPLNRRMAWAYDLAAARLDACCDPACQTRYQKISNDNPTTKNP